MTRRSKKRQPQEFLNVDRSQPLAAGAVDRRASASIPEAARSCGPPAVCGLLLLAVIAVFAQTGNHEFVNYDDEVYVYGNWHVTRGLTGEGAVWAIAGFHSPTGTRWLGFRTCSTANSMILSPAATT